mgnify:CR=1 FL=1
MGFARMLAKGSRFALGVAAVTLAVVPTASAMETAVPSTTSPMWQTNGITYALASTGGVVYAGGTFPSVRPPGAAAGSGEVARTRLAAFNANTGALVTSFNHTLNGNVFSIAASPDGKTVYVGGDFTTVDGATRNRIAAFNAQTGALTSWSSSVYQRVTSISVSPSAVYIGGGFTTAGGGAVQRLAKLSPTTGQADPAFAATADAYVYSIALSADYSKLYVAGQFTALSGNSDYYGAGAVDSQTGAAVSFPATSAIPRPTASCVSIGKVVRTDANGAYFGAEGTGGGCFDGTFAANNDGTLKWKSTCLGATQAVQPLGDELFTGSHTHDCAEDQANGDPKAFPEVGWSKGLARRLLSRSLATGKMGDWYPQTNGGIGEGLGPRVMATDGTQLFVGGEFTQVNGVNQQSLARFSPADGDQAVPSQPVAPTTVARGDGKVSIFVQAPLDTDDPDITVRLYRDGGNTPIATKQVTSLFWKRPIVAFTDDGLATGSSHTYRADAVETNGPNAGARSAASDSVTVLATAPAYAKTVLSQNPTLFWRFDDARAPAVADASDGLEGGTSWLGTTFNAAGANDGGKAVTFDGSSGSIASTDALPSPTTYSVDAWFKTTSTSGGKIIGFGNAQQGYDFGGNPALSSSYDKHIYMTNAGKLIFGVYNGSFDTITTSASYNDGQWHQVTGTQGPNGMVLYVDGVRVGRNGVTTNQGYTGYWRVGGDNLGAWPSQPSSNYFAGTIDDVSVYGSALTAQQVAAQYVASGRTPDLPPSPTDTYGKAVYDDGPSAFWRLDETSGTSAADASGNQNPAGYVGGVTQGGGSAIGSQGTSTALNGANGNVAQSNAQTSPSSYTEELWFKTTTTSGGKIIGFGNAQTGNSSNYDKHVYMTNSGQLIFGVWNNGPDIVTSPQRYNDGDWHYLVASQGSGGLALYVDGQLVGSNPASANQGYNGYWRVGGDNLGGWPSQPSSNYFAGSVDEVAIYDFALTGEQISAHYAAAGHTGPDITAPTAAITAPADGATVGTGNVTVTATAADNVGVTSLDLQVDGSTVATDSDAPYTFTWNAGEGQHTLRVVAHDAAGNTGTSDPVTVTVQTPDTTSPATAITAPADGATVYGPTAVTATASDNVGVTSVALKVDGTTVGTDTTAPYEFNWNATDVGDHTLTTVATDAAGNTGTSAEVHVTVQVPPDTTAPSAPGTLTGEATGQTAVHLAWGAASDNVGVTGYVVVRDGTDLPGVVTGLSYDDTGLTAGDSHTYSVLAVDAAGNRGPASNEVTVTLPTTPSVLFADTFDGADGAPWNASSWTTSVSAGSAAIQGNAGVLTVNDTASAYARAQSSGLTATTDSELLTSFKWNSNTAVSYLSFYMRGSGGWQNGYRPRTGIGVQIQSNSATVRVQKNVNGTMTDIGGVTGAQQVTTAKQWLRLRVTGDTIQFKIWTDGQAEPSAWKSEITDASVSAAGQLFVSLNRAGSNTGTKAVTLDDLTIVQG